MASPIISRFLGANIGRWKFFVGGFTTGLILKSLQWQIQQRSRPINSNGGVEKTETEQGSGKKEFNDDKGKAGT
jgi:hypothetical protein